MSSTLIGVILLVTFIGMIVFLIRGGNPILTMILMAILWSLLGNASFSDIYTNVIQGTVTKYAPTIMLVVFGTWFAQVIVQTGIASSIIRSVVELGGRSP